MKKIFLFTILITFLKTCPNDQYCSECRLIDGKHTCLTCNYSLITSHNTCESLDTKIKNCIVYNQISSKSEKNSDLENPQVSKTKIKKTQNLIPKNASNKKITKTEKNQNSSTSCKVCKRNHGPSESGKDCIKCLDPLCSTCPNGTCTSCSNNIIPVNNSCQITPKSTFCVDTKCEICDFRQECVKCVRHFALNQDGRCVGSVGECLEGGDQGCFKCEFGFYVDSGFLCRVFTEVLPHSFFEQFVVFLVVCAFLGILAFFAWKKYREKCEEELRRKSESDEGVTETLM